MKLLCPVICLALAIGSSTVSAESLNEAALKFPGLRVSAAVKPPDTYEATYANTLRLHYSPSPENATKWASTHPSQYTYDWSDADAIAGFARNGGQQIRGHTLLWHQSIPSWVTNGGFTTNQLRDILFHHIDTVAGRYQGSAYCWDVVNEAFNDDGSLRTSFWYNNPGFGYASNGTRYIEEAFRRAATADPNAKLIYNDYSTEAVNAKSDAVYAMAQDFLNRGVPLHGIGFQMHISGINYASLRSNLKRFNDLGLDLHITEMDVRIPIDTNGVSMAADLESQAEIYWNVLGVALSQPRFKAFQTWGFTDKDSWVPGFYPGYGNALPFDKNYQRKPAYWAIWNALANQAEKLPVLAWSPGDSTNLFYQDTLSAGAGMQLQADGTNDFMTLGMTVPFAGQWDVKVGYRVSGASGKFQLAAAPEGSGTFVNIGTPVDAYGSSEGTGFTDLGTNSFSGSGNWQFRFTVVGQNASASDYNLTIDYIRITPVSSNTYPTISSVTDKTTAENTSAGPFSFTVGDAQTPAASLTVQAISLNTNLLPTANIVLGGSGSSRTVTLTPTVDQFGAAAVLLLVSDGTNQTPETFALNVTPVNTAPVCATTNIAVAENGSTDVNLSTLATDIETPSGAMRYEVSAAVGGTVALLADGMTARFTPALNYIGPASFRYTATDAGPDGRLLIYYSFEPPDVASDKSVTDNSSNALTGTLEEFGSGTCLFDTNVPALLAPYSSRSLALTESGAGNGARLEALLPSSTYSLKNADWSFVTWFRRNSTVNDDFLFHVGAGDGFSGDGDELELGLTTGNQLQLRHYNTGNAQDVNLTSGFVPVGEWHHAAVVFDRTNSNAGLLKLYLDGVQVGSTTSVTWALDQSYELVFGGAKKGNEARWLNGQMDDIALYQSVLTGADIAGLAGGRTVGHLGGLSRSNTVTLNVLFSNQPPVLAPLVNTQVLAGAWFNVAASAYDPDALPQELTFSLLNPPLGMVINPTNGLLTWRPTIAQGGTSNLISVVVTEAGWRTNLSAVADLYVRDGSYANSNFGSDTILTVKQDPTAGFTREAFLRFAVPPYPGGLALAQLRLQPNAANLPGVHAVALVTNDTWDELNTTWNTKPVANVPVATWLPQAGVPVQASVADAILQKSPATGLLSLRVYATNSTADGRVDYASRESGGVNAPRLSLVYTNPMPLSVTQSFWVTVISPQSPVISGAQYSGGAFRMSVAGEGGPDHIVQTSTNLLNWNTWLSTNGAPGAFIFDVTNQTAEPQKFYRILLGP